MSARSLEQNRKLYDALIAREHAPQKKHAISLLGGEISAQVEASKRPETACKEDDDGDGFLCTIQAPVGTDVLGEEHAMFCFVAPHPLPFGPLMERMRQGSGLSEVPELAVSRVGDGVDPSDAQNGGAVHRLVLRNASKTGPAPRKPSSRPPATSSPA